MFLNAKWIGAAAGETGFRSTDALTDAQEEERRRRALSGEDPIRRGSLLLRRDFVLDAPAASASLAAAGLGFYRVTVNGCAPADAPALAPVVSDYERRVKYDVYDVASLLRPGRNCLCFELGPGWFTGNPKYWGWQQTWYGNPRLLAALTVRGADGGGTRVVTDGAWKQAPGTVTASCVYDGETQDLSAAPADWDRPDFCADAWENAAEVEAPGGALTPRVAPPVRVTRVLRPVSQKQLSPTEILFDFGENAAAIPCVTARGQKGDTVTLRHAEFLKPDGTPDPRSENRALCTDVFVLADDRPAALSPRFIWHGYRYMTAALSSASVRLEAAESRVVHSDVDVTGSFLCGSEDLNALHRMYVRTLLSCLQGVPVDCPQRDERKAWLGDAYAASEACIYNFDMRTFYEDWLEDLRRGRNPAHGFVPYISPAFGAGDDSVDWSLAYPAILLECCERYGDRSLAARHYEALKAHTEYYVSRARDGEIPPCCFGDWCTPDRPDGQEPVAFRAGDDDHRQNPPFAATVFYAQTLRLAAELAALADHPEDAAVYRARREEARRALLKKHFDPVTGRFGSGGQFLQTMLLAEDLPDAEDRPAAVAALLREIEASGFHPCVGVLGLRRVYELLCELGRPDVAYKMLTVRGWPGQLHMLSGGRTTLTERLDFSGSGNHCMFASPDAFLYRCLGGLRIDRLLPVPVTVAPYCPPDLPFVRCAQRLPEGELFCAWQRENGVVTFEVRVPAGLPARLELRAGAGTYAVLLPEGGTRTVALREKKTGS